jgi:hypothetical protein
MMRVKQHVIRTIVKLAVGHQLIDISLADALFWIVNLRCSAPSEGLFVRSVKKERIANKILSKPIKPFLNSMLHQSERF